MSRAVGAYEPCKGSRRPLFAPLSPRDLQKLRETSVSELPSRLHDLLRRHHTPVRYLFRCLDGNHDGMLTREELWKALRCFGLEVSRAEARAIFRGLLEFAINDGDVALSYRSVQKALLRNEVSRVKISEQPESKNGAMRERVGKIEMAHAKACLDKETAMASATKAEQAAARAAADAAKAKAAQKALKVKANKAAAAAAEASKQAEALREYLDHSEEARVFAEECAEELHTEVVGLRKETALMQRELEASRREELNEEIVSLRSELGAARNALEEAQMKETHVEELRNELDSLRWKLAAARLELASRGHDEELGVPSPNSTARERWRWRQTGFISPTSTARQRWREEQNIELEEQMERHSPASPTPGRRREAIQRQHSITGSDLHWQPTRAREHGRWSAADLAAARYLAEEHFFSHREPRQVQHQGLHWQDGRDGPHSPWHVIESAMANAST